MKAHLSLNTTQREFTHPYSLFKWLLIPIAFLSRELTLLLFLIAYLVESYFLFREIQKHSLKRPKWTMKSAIIVFVGVLAVFITPFTLTDLFGNNDGLFLVISDRLTPVIVSLIILIFWPISNLFKKRIIKKAKNKINRQKDLITIGITGSYGKSTTKNILATILEDSSAITTPGNTNTEIGVAEVVNKKLTPTAKYFIAEMGAYKIGEIKKITEIAKPKYGIITAVSNQHLALFGSIENLKQAKYELIESLPSDGIAFFNVDDENCRELAAKTKRVKVIKYGTSTEADYRAAGQTLITPKGTFNFETQILGEYNLINIAGATAVASELGISFDKMVEKLSQVRNPKGTMESFELKDGTLVIDDSYNENKNGAIAALKTIQKFTDKEKVVVLMPIIELGTESEKVHEKIGEELGKFECKIFYPQKDFFENIKKGLKNMESENEIIKTDSDADLIKKINKLREERTLILLEGRVPRRLREALL